jgi:NADP-reducing hydrogenase subunit HndB
VSCLDHECPPHRDAQTHSEGGGSGEEESVKLDDLRRIRDRVSQEVSLRRGGMRAKVLVAMGTSAIAAGAREVLDAFLNEIRDRKLTDVAVTQAGDRGLTCWKPIVEVQVVGEPSVLYGEMNAAKARRVVSEHIVGGTPVGEYVIQTGCE